MKITIDNMAEMVGDYDGEDLTLQSTIAQTEIVEGLTATKVPSKTLWAGGKMTYTVTINNTTEIDFENPIFTDVLDSHITLVANSVKVNGTTKAYTFTGQTLTVNLDTIAANGSAVVTFDVSIVTP